MRRKKLAKKSKRKISVIQRDIWDQCKILIRTKYGHDCYTCPAKGLEGSNWHTGHMFPKASLGAYLKYDLRNLRPQCYNCNINNGGQGAVFIENMRRIEGNEYVDQIIKDKQISVQAYDFYVELLEKYKKMTNNIEIDINY